MVDNNNPSSSKAPSNQHVFISYSRTDREACIALRLALEQAGLNVFQDENTIRTGDRWVTKLEEALRNCSAFVVLIGSDGIQRWVGAEVQVALLRHLSPHDDAERLPIFPVLLDDAKPEALPIFLKLFQIEQWTPTKQLPKDLIQAIQTHSIRINSQHDLEDRCPYLGLSAFTRNDVRFFFGRRQEVLEALSCLGDQQGTNPGNLNKSGGSVYHRWLQIEGNSGSGKSSLVQAGMLLMIEQGALWARTGFDQWTIIGPMMPGKKPLEKLAETLEQGLIRDPEKRDSLGRLNRLKEDKSGLALASTIKDFKQPQANGAFLLIIDQFEELFTFAEEDERKQFDRLLSNALQDTNCPLFLISTVRTDFLDRFEYLQNLQTIYNSHCKRYFLPTISAKGLREVIEQPARLAGLDVREVTTVILNDAENEIGALPLVENALTLLFQHQQEPNKLSGDYYRQQGGIAGMLSEEADKLLARIEHAVPSGRIAALELLLRLTRINDEGQHARQRITLEEAITVAGDGNDESGRRVIAMLSGQRDINLLNTEHQNVLRLITLNEESGQHYVDLIHETLIRTHNKDEKTGKLIGYWPTLYNHIDKNRDRELFRQQIKIESNRWQHSKWLGRLWHLSYSITDIRNYCKLKPPKNSLEHRFLVWSLSFQVGFFVIWLGIIFLLGVSIFWAVKHDSPLEVKLFNPLYNLGYKPFPEMVAIPVGTFEISNTKNKATIKIKKPFQLGKYEVTYRQYDYFVWAQKHAGHVTIEFPDDAPGGRGNQPVVNISYDEAAAYATWLGNQLDKQCRLPTLFEWEYAARAPKNNIDGLVKSVGHANCTDCMIIGDTPTQAVPVNDKKFKENPFGLHHMLGNVSEWTCSNDLNYSSNNDLEKCPAANDSEISHVIIGGYWEDTKQNVEALARKLVQGKKKYIGFRVLCSNDSHTTE